MFACGHARLLLANQARNSRLGFLRDAERIADCRDENISLPDCPCGVLVADGIARVISEQAETLDLVKRTAQFRRDVSAKDKMLTEGGYLSIYLSIYLSLYLSKG